MYYSKCRTMSTSELFIGGIYLMNVVGLGKIEAEDTEESGPTPFQELRIAGVGLGVVSRCFSVGREF